MKTLVRINGVVDEFTSVMIDTITNKATIERGINPIVDIKNKGVFIEINIYGNPRDLENR